MGKVAIVTDSNSGITQAKGKEMGIFVLPMPFFINGELFLEDITLTQEEFYKRLGEDADISTSQPSPGDVMDLWDKALEEYDELVHIPMSSGLSSSCETALMLAQEYGGKVQVVNNQRISVTQRQSVEDALELAKRGKTAKEIKDYLEETKYDSSIYIMVDTLYYLKKGGRLTPAAAALGTLLKLKPVLQIQGEKLDSYAKARTVKQARTIMIDAIKSDFAKRFGDVTGENMHIFVAYSKNKEAALDFKAQIEAAIPGRVVEVVDPLSLSVACHIGPGSLAVACAKKLS